MYEQPELIAKAAPAYGNSTFPPPRPFQITAHEALRQGFRDGHKNQVIMAATGAGKAYLGMRICHEALLRGKRAVFACDRITLINQLSDSADAYGLTQHGVIQAGHWRTDLSLPFQVASIQTLAKRGFPECDVLVWDECFVAGTVIDAADGPINIDCMRPGHCVYNATGVGLVESIFSKIVFDTVVVRLSNGTVIECTEDHPIFTESGWVKAGALERGARLFRREDVRGLWQGDEALHPDVGSAFRASRVGGNFQQKDVLRSILREEAEESNAQRSGENEGVRNPKADWSSARDSRRERHGDDKTTGNALFAIARRMAGRVRDTYRRIAEERTHKPLQDRHRQSIAEDRSRGGWEQSLSAVTARSGCEEGCLSACPWVESVEAVERADGIRVFNLRVAGHPSYYANGVLVHNCHSIYKPMAEFAMSTKAAVIGLSATPFAKGMGKIFTNLINAATMHDLTEQGILVPMKIFACTRPDMTGAETSGGEWTDSAAAERGMDIIGDVVTEWTKHASARKTIVFGATIAHCEELCKQFNEAGIMAAVFCSKTPDGERLALLNEYRKRDSALRVLISVEALAKGFDVPDVECVCDCRPLRKSLSSAIQMWGRGLRCSPDTGKQDCVLLDFCIATGQRVFTTRGLVPIQAILLSDKLWDGHEFVTHSGVISRGIKPIIEYAGLKATACHPVKTKEGWRTLGDCAEKQTAIISTGIGRTAIRECEGYFARPGMAWSARTSFSACVVRVRQLWLQGIHRLGEFAQRIVERMSGLQSAATSPEMAVCAGSQHEAALHESEGAKVRRLWRSGDRVPFRLADYRRGLDSEELGYPGKLGMDGVGSDRKQRPLRTGEHSMGNSPREYGEQAHEQMESVDAQVRNRAPGNKVRRDLFAFVAFCWNVIRGNRGAVSQTIAQAEGEVWDILNCGPRNSFTCEGLLVHNSGNIVRFAESFSDVYHNGLGQLNEGERLDKEIRRDDEENANGKACPACGFHPFAKRCISCGFEVQKASTVEHLPGELQEIRIGKKKYADDQRHLWEQAVSYARQHSAPDKQYGRAFHIYKDIVGDAPPRSFRLDGTPNVPITAAVAGKIRSKQIAYAKMRAKGLA